MHRLSPFFYIETKFAPLEKRTKNDRQQLRWNFSEEELGTPFLTTKGMMKFWKS